MKNKLRTKLFVLLASAVFVCSLVAFTACSGGDHQLTFVEEQPATCTEAGHVAYYLCSHCGKLYADENAETELSEADTVIAALGHDLTHHEAVAATCTADGSVEYWSCARCELNFSDAEGTAQIENIVVKASHKIDFVEQIDPTADGAGTKEHYACSVCHTCFEDRAGKKEIDPDELVIPQLVMQDIAVTVEVYGTDGVKEEDWQVSELSGKLFFFGDFATNTYEEISVTATKTLGLEEAAVGKYTVSAYGFADVQFEVKADTDTYTLGLYRTIAYAGNDCVTVNDAEGTVLINGSGQESEGADGFFTTWAGSAEVMQNVGTDMVFETTVKIGGTIDQFQVNPHYWTERTTMQRFQISVTESGQGFYIWTCGINNDKEQNIADVMSAAPSPESSQESGKGVDLIKDDLRPDFGWMHAQAKGNGLQLRIVRIGENITLYAYNGEEWISIGTVEAEEGDATKIVLYGLAVEWTFGDMSAKSLTYVEAKDATKTEPGNMAYYTDGTNYWFEDGTPTTAEGVKTYAPVSVTITWDVTSLFGEETSLADGTVVTLAARQTTYTYTVGGEALTEMVIGDYTVTAEGYAAANFTVPENGGAITIQMEEVKEIAAKDLVNNAWGGSAPVELPEDVTGDFVLDITLKIRDNNTEWGEPMTWQRWAIRLTDNNKGFYFWGRVDKGVNYVTLREFFADNLTNSMAEKQPAIGLLGEAELGFIYGNAIGGGVQLRILRAGNTFYLYAMNGGEWIKIGSVVGSADDIIDIEVYGVECSYEWSKASLADVTYHEAKDPVVGGASGNVAYYTDGENYWLADGTPTTADAVVISAVSVSVNVDAVTIYGDATTIADGTELTFTGEYGTYTYTMGGTALDAMLVGDYLVTADGYAETIVTVPEDGGSITVALEEVIYIAAEAVGSGNAWAGSAPIELPDDVSANFLFEITLKIPEYNKEWGVPMTQQRWAIRLTEGNTGFYFWGRSDKGVNYVTLREFTEANLTNGMAEGNIIGLLGESELGFVYANAIGDGVQLRILRAGNTFYLYALNGGEWIKVGSVASSAGDALDIEVYGVECSYEWSDASCVNVTYYAAKDPVVGEDGNIAYYTDGENYWLPDGTMTTKDAVVISTVNVSITVNGVTFNGEPMTVENGTVLTFTGAYGTYSYTVGGEALTAMLVDTYTVTAQGYGAATVTVPKDGGAITVTMPKAETIVAEAVGGDNAWAGSVPVEIPEELPENFVFEITLRIRDYNEVWNVPMTQQRWAIRLTEGNTGFYFWGRSDKGVSSVTIRQFIEGNLTNCMGEGSSVGALSENDLGFIYANAIGSGVKLRIVATSDSFELYANNDSEWVKVATVARNAGDALDIELYGVECTYDWYNASFASAEAQEPETQA